VTCSGNVKCISRDTTQIIINTFEVLTAHVKNLCSVGAGRTSKHLLFNRLITLKHWKS